MDKRRGTKTMIRSDVASVVIVFLASSCLRADHFTVELKVQAGKSSLSAATETASLGAIPKKRGVLQVKAGNRIIVRWTLTNKAPKEPLKNVLVHFFAVREKEIGQKTTPKLNKDVAAETALTMDFNPKDKAQGELDFTLEQAGPYLLRIETIGAAVGADGHEHFAALELLVQEK
jgi:hypothetical protein